MPIRIGEDNLGVNVTNECLRWRASPGVRCKIALPLDTAFPLASIVTRIRMVVRFVDGLTYAQTVELGSITSKKPEAV